MTFSGRISTLALAATLLASPAYADGSKPKDNVSFGLLQSANSKDVEAKAKAWLTASGKFDAKAFEAIWTSEDRPLVDKLADTFAMGDENAAKLLKLARDPEAPAPEGVPSYLKDTKVPAFVRSNLTVAYSKALANRQVYEDALEALRLVKADQTIEPATYFFNKAVCEHGLMMQPEATDSIVRLLEDVSEVPERYKMVAVLMHFDMQSWQDKDLGWVARKMENVRRRLDLTRGGEKTQKIQREVVVRLNEMIKEMENQKKGNCSGGGNCPNGGEKQDGPNSMKPGNPLDDSRLGGISGAGTVDGRKLTEMAKVWGKLPEKERAKAMVELTRDLPVKYKEAIETYLKGIAQEKK